MGERLRKYTVFVERAGDRYSGPYVVEDSCPSNAAKQVMHVGAPGAKIFVMGDAVFGYRKVSTVDAIGVEGIGY